eukprot:c17475_g1_i2.p1 GENE.c17475_g1_i2~~c17475_g1_i2.p1  ORF type:complete len:112 (-),score=31.27 c17475_g1_i2:139-474(-)
MPAPLLSPIYNELVEIDEAQDLETRKLQLTALVATLEVAPKALLISLLVMLHQVAKSAAVNRMTPQNLAVVFAPNILSADGFVSAKNEALMVERVNRVVCWLIELAPHISA